VRINSRSFVVVFPLLLAAAAVAFAFWGWSDILASASPEPALPPEQAAWRSFQVLLADGVYNDVTDPRLRLARWLGAGALTWAISGAGLLFFEGRLRGWRARTARGHLLIVGDHPVARAAATLAVERDRRPVWVANGPEEVPGASVIAAPSPAEAALRAGGAAGARTVLVAAGSDAETAGLVLAAQAQGARDVRAHVLSPWLIEHLDVLDRGAGAFVFSEAGAVARHILRRHPPWLLAARRGQERVHLVVVGFGDLGDAIVQWTVLNGRTADLGRPRITVLDPAADERRKAFLSRHPHVGEAIDLDFQAVAPEAAAAEDLDRLVALAARDPITAVYVCRGAGADALTSAVALHQGQARGVLGQVPVFVRLRDGPELHPAAGGAASLDDGPLVSFGGLVDLVGSSGALDPDPDAAARLYHEAYRSFGSGPAAKAEWDDLSQAGRQANRRAIDHIPVKLASAGFDLEPWLARTGGAGIPELAPGEQLIVTPEERERLSILEHDRWAADKYLGGWRFGPVRDDLRRLHDNLVPFAELSREIQDYDRRLIDWLAGFLRHAPGGVSRRG
jgi:hypothetical protein